MRRWIFFNMPCAQAGAEHVVVLSVQRYRTTEFSALWVGMHLPIRNLRHCARTAGGHGALMPEHLHTHSDFRVAERPAAHPEASKLMRNESIAIASIAEAPPAESLCVVLIPSPPSPFIAAFARGSYPDTLP